MCLVSRLWNATQEPVACIAAGMTRGAQIFRVHNVKAAVQAVKMLWAVEDSR
jgi:dihydropteroate synthase